MSAFPAPLARVGGESCWVHWAGRKGVGSDDVVAQPAAGTTRGGPGNHGHGSTGARSCRRARLVVPLLSPPPGRQACSAWRPASGSFAVSPQLLGLLAWQPTPNKQGGELTKKNAELRAATAVRQGARWCAAELAVVAARWKLPALPGTGRGKLEANRRRARGGEERLKANSKQQASSVGGWAGRVPRAAS